MKKEVDKMRMRRMHGRRWEGERKEVKVGYLVQDTQGATHVDEIIRIIVVDVKLAK
jgi:hypothetical protein